ncbi:MAG: transcription termination factor NusA [Patescibacteria group bacterium]
MAQSPIMAAITQICQEKNIPVESVIATIEAALAAAYRKDFGQKNQNIKVEYDPEAGQSRVFDVKIVVADELKAKAEAEAAERAAAIERGEIIEPVARPVFEDHSFKPEAEEEVAEEAELRYNPKLHISVTDAQELKAGAVEGDEIRVELGVPEEYGRMAAQTAKQVIIQRLREAERTSIYEEFKDQQGLVLTGTVQRRDGRAILIDLTRGVGIMPPEEQVDRERYRIGDRLKVYVKSVELGTRGAQIVLSRRSPEIVRELFAMEIPEVANGTIEIKAIAREAGNRSKVAVFTDDEGIDPIGSCVGQRGSRVQTIITELSGEKIDIIEWSENIGTFITNSLSPAKVLSLEVNDADKRAVVTVASDQLSLAIGKLGQNVRLAAKLTGHAISIVELTGDNTKRELTEEELAGEAERAAAAAATDAATAASAEPIVEETTAPVAAVAAEEVPPAEPPAAE